MSWDIFSKRHFWPGQAQGLISKEKELSQSHWKLCYHSLLLHGDSGPQSKNGRYLGLGFPRNRYWGKDLSASTSSGRYYQETPTEWGIETGEAAKKGYIIKSVSMAYPCWGAAQNTSQRFATFIPQFPFSDLLRELLPDWCYISPHTSNLLWAWAEQAPAATESPWAKRFRLCRWKLGRWTPDR